MTRKEARKSEGIFVRYRAVGVLMMLEAMDI
jgi:hypothetical protein